MIGFTVIGGYLGAGKTTLLNHLLTNNESLRIALLINDFGAINIDADLIERQTDSQINLTNGCVCCGLSDGFDQAIEQLLANPTGFDHIVVEASGVADVATLAQYGQAPQLQLDGVLVVADAETVRAKASDKYVAKTVQRQLQAADLIVLNKVDLIDANQRAELRDWLGQYVAPNRVIPASFCKVPLELLIGARAESDDGQPAPAASHQHSHDYESWQYQGAAPLTEDAVSNFLAALPPTILRGKGWFGLADKYDQRQLHWQRVGERETLTSGSLGRNAQPDASATGYGTQIVTISLAGKTSTAELDALAEQYLH